MALKGFARVLLWCSVQNSENFTVRASPQFKASLPLAGDYSRRVMNEINIRESDLLHSS